ncbi:hypothetical protein F5887DRAFT_918816 [Amanita rubescens]|nr:hypothetical protein F5887DRAFT_918816 [Amanita rubescens]
MPVDETGNALTGESTSQVQTSLRTASCRCFSNIINYREIGRPLSEEPEDARRDRDAIQAAQFYFWNSRLSPTTWSSLRPTPTTWDGDRRADAEATPWSRRVLAADWSHRYHGRKNDKNVAAASKEHDCRHKGVERVRREERKLGECITIGVRYRRRGKERDLAQMLRNEGSLFSLLQKKGVNRPPLQILCYSATSAQPVSKQGFMPSTRSVTTVEGN